MTASAEPRSRYANVAITAEATGKVAIKLAQRTGLVPPPLRSASSEEPLAGEYPGPLEEVDPVFGRIELDCEMPDEWWSGQPQGGSAIIQHAEQSRLDEDPDVFDTRQLNILGTGVRVPEGARQIADDDAAAFAPAREVIDDDHPAMGESGERGAEGRLDAQTDPWAQDDHPRVNGHPGQYLTSPNGLTPRPSAARLRHKPLALKPKL